MKKRALLTVMILILLLTGNALGDGLPVFVHEEPAGPELPDPGLFSGSEGRLYEKDFAYEGVLYDAYQYEKPESAETFLFDYFPALTQAGFEPELGRIEDYRVIRIFPPARTGEPALLFSSYQGYMLLMVPTDMAFLTGGTGSTGAAEETDAGDTTGEGGRIASPFSAVSDKLQKTDAAPEPPAGDDSADHTNTPEMIYIPAGEFLLGSDPAVDPYAAAEEETPQLRVYLDGYWIGKTEVTNAQYRSCVEAGACELWPYVYLDDPDLSSKPVNYIPADQAERYCAWIGGRLPTEYEWEKAARGTDGRIYPWGNEEPSPENDRANIPYDGGAGGSSRDVLPVGSFPKGQSPYGLMDMAGNVWEWTSTWYSPDFYETLAAEEALSGSAVRNPTGPENGTRKVIRGGSCAPTEGKLYPVFTRAANRSYMDINSSYYVGFRCVIPVPNPASAAEEPAAVEPAAEESLAEEPLAEEPAAEEPAADVVASVDGREITADKFIAMGTFTRYQILSSYKQYVSYYSMFGLPPDELNEQFEQTLGESGKAELGRSVIDQLAFFEMIDIEAEEAGISVSDQEVTDQMKQIFESSDTEAAAEDENFRADAEMQLAQAFGGIVTYDFFRDYVYHLLLEEKLIDKALEDRVFEAEGDELREEAEDELYQDMIARHTVESCEDVWMPLVPTEPVFEPMMSEENETEAIPGSANDEADPGEAAAAEEIPGSPYPEWSRYDALIREIKTTTDFAKRVDLMHQAEDMLMDTGAILPLYYYNDLYMQRSDVEGIYSSVFGTKYFLYAAKGDETTLRINLGSEPDHLDPALNSSVDGACLAANSFAGLYMYDPEGRLVPQLAEGYEVTEDGMTYTFTLKDGLKWSDGSDLTADDFVYAWKRAADPKTAADYSYMFDVIAGYDELQEGDADAFQVSAPDAKTLTVTLKSPCAYMLDLMAFPTYFPVKQSAVEAAPDWERNPGSWAQEAGFVSNGAYTLERWDHDHSMVYVKNPYYYDAENVRIERLELMLSFDDTAIYSAYRAGDLDFADTVPTDEIRMLKDRDPEFHIIDNLGTYYVIFNVKSPLFAGKTVEQANAMRKAFGLLIDRQYIIDTVAQCDQMIATSYLPAGMADGNGGIFKDAAGWDYPVDDGYYGADVDIEGARALLESAGFRFGEDGRLSPETPISFEYLTNESTGHVAIAECIQQDLAEVGISMTIRSIDWNIFLNERKAGNYDVARSGWLADFNDPINMLEMWTTNSGNNDAQFGRY